MLPWPAGTSHRPSNRHRCEQRYRSIVDVGAQLPPPSDDEATVNPELDSLYGADAPGFSRPRMAFQTFVTGQPDGVINEIRPGGGIDFQPVPDS